MDCRTYEDDLKDFALAAGTLPPKRERELRAHIADCASCRATFTAEQALHETLDTALRAEVNATVPPGMVARIRAATANSAEERLAFAWRAPVFAAMAALAIALVVFVGVRETHDVSSPPQSGRAVPSLAAQAVPTAPRIAPPPPRRLHAASTIYTVRSKGSVQSVQSKPEVLVSPEENGALQRWVALLSGRPLATQSELNITMPDKPLVLEAIVVAQLEIKPLIEEHPQ